MKQARRPTTADLVAIARWAKVFEAPDFTPGDWVTKPGTLPFFSQSERVRQFTRELYDRGLPLADFDWPSWSAEAHRLMAAPEAIATINLTTCRKLLTALVRSDRFVENALAAAINDGVMARVLRRIGELATGPVRAKRQ